MKVGVVASTLGLLACGTYGLINLRMEFRPEWLMDPKSESKATLFSLSLIGGHFMIVFLFFSLLLVDGSQEILPRAGRAGQHLRQGE